MHREVWPTPFLWLQSKFCLAFVVCLFFCLFLLVTHVILKNHRDNYENIQNSIE